MQVCETNLQALISGTKQFRVPLFQRTYTWGDHQHSQLWEDILSQYEQMLPDSAGTSSSNHFIGSFVLSPAPSISATVPAFLVVDGQQRLTTLTLALCALRERAALADPQAYDRITYQYLVNQFARGPEKWKFVPTDQDRKAYEECIAGHPGAEKNRITAAYRFFEAHMAQTGPDEAPLDLALLERAMVSRLSIVDITAQQGDNVHRIFESLNATGVGLTQADLLRNYLFMLLPTREREVYHDVWLPMQDELGPEHLEGLARVDLRRRGIDVRDDSVYQAQQDRLQEFEKDEAQIEAEIRDLAARARQDVRILRPEKEPHAEIRLHLQFLRRWQAGTTHPLMMYLYEFRDERGLTDAEMVECLRYIESFIVRRLLTGVSTRNLNRIVVQTVTHLRQHPEEPLVQSLRGQLSKERRYWATDDEIRLAARSRPLYYYGRAGQRRLVLERLEESFEHREGANLADLDLSVEHIMSQSLSVEWSEMLRDNGEDAGDVHRELLHTLGNLTLTAYNPELSNHPLKRKQEIYDKSHLSLNRALVQESSWTRADIEKRAADLAERAIAIWPGPTPGAVEPAVGFDWSRVYAAMATLPDGQWTAFSDLAVLAGTSASAAEAHLLGRPGVPKMHRVLTPEGRISADFRWSERDDHRDPRALLEQEGVTFDSEERADPAQQLDPDALQGLLGWFDPDDDYPAAG